MPNIFTMPDYRNNIPQLINAVQALNPRLIRATEISHEMLHSAGSNEIGFDHRDVPVMAMLIPPGDDYEQKVRDMCNDLKSPKREDKTKWLDMLYNFRDSIDVSNMDLNDPETARKAVTLVAVNQTLATMEQAFPNNLTRQYTPEELRGIAAKDIAHVAFTGLTMTVLHDANVKLMTEMTLPFFMDGLDSAFSSLQHSVIAEKSVYGEKYDQIPAILPPILKEYHNADINVIDPLNPMQVSNLPIINTIDTLFNSHESNFAKNMGLARNDLVVIDGKTVSEMVADRGGNLSVYDKLNLGNAIIATALASGEHRVSKIVVEQGEGGKPVSRLEDVKPDLKPFGNTIEEDYHPIRRAMFNWGPFKCKTLSEKADALYSKPPSKSEQKKTNHILAGLSEKAEIYDRAVQEAHNHYARTGEHKDISVKEAIDYIKLQKEETIKRGERNKQDKKPIKQPQKQREELNRNKNPKDAQGLAKPKKPQEIGIKK